MWFKWINIVVSCSNITFSEEFCVLSKVCLWKAINMLRFFSRRKPKGRKDQRYGSGGGYSNVGNGTSRKPLGPTSKHKMLDCKVIFLDGEDETFPITVSTHDCWNHQVFIHQYSKFFGSFLLTKIFDEFYTSII